MFDNKQHSFLYLLIVALLLAGCSNAALPEATPPSPSMQTQPSISETISGTETVPEGSTFEIHYLDVGQADAALIICDNSAMLIDGGNAEDSSLIYAYLETHNINHLDYIVCTHSHEDHVGGLSGALNYATVGTAYCSVTDADTRAFSNFVKYLAKQDKEIVVPSAGDSFSLGSAEVTILGPVAHNEDPNNMSIVLRIQYGKTSFLFTGDAELDEETSILDAGYDISCDVLKVGHHGSRSSTNYRWLREAAPSYAVISVGIDNEYGHPSEDVLSRLRDAEVTVYRTDMQGHIVCASNGETVSFITERNADADTLRDAGAGGNHKDHEMPATAEDTAKAEITYICNTNSMKFHYPDCSSVADMADHNKLEVASTREELIEQGYTPCGRCKP